MNGNTNRNFKASYKSKAVQLFLSGTKSRKDVLDEYQLNDRIFNEWIYSFYHKEILGAKRENAKLEKENMFLKQIIRILSE